MKKNIGIIDLVIRLLIAALVIVLYFTHVISGLPAILLLIFAGIMVLTSFLGLCPLYLAFGISTKGRQ
jgi:hypothetical protein